MIRTAILADIPRMLEMGRRFLRETTYDKHLADNPDCMVELGEKLIRNGTVIVAERSGTVVGMLGFVIHSHFMSGELMAGEVFWWVEPECRGEGVKMLREMEKQARAAGAKSMQMIAPNDKVAAFYSAMDYQFVESTYQKSL